MDVLDPELQLAYWENSGTVTWRSFGYQIRLEDDAPYEIWAYRMLFNWRLVVGYADSMTLESGYCYFGTDLSTLVKAIEAGLEWKDALHTEPVGYDKKAFG